MTLNLTKDMLKKFKENLKRFSKDEDKAFIYWFINAFFGKNIDDQSVAITDGSSDGEIDAIVFDGKYTFVIQSKFSTSPFVNKPTSLPLGDYTKFDSTISNFENRKKFDEYLETIEDDLKPKYRMLFDKYQDNPDKVFWKYIAFHKKSPAGENRCNNFEKIKFYYWDSILDLYHLELEGGTPIAKPLIVKFTNDITFDDEKTGIISYAAQVYLRDFIKYVREYDPNLLIISRNVRNDLRSKINEGIRNTYEHFPDEFWYSHNGITLICDSVLKEGKFYKISHPNVINGSQTINSIKSESVEDNDAKVLLRIMVIPPTLKDSKELIEKIIFRTNNQNKMYAWDLKANDSVQVSIAKNFRDFKIYYSRRRGDWESKQRENLHKGLKNLKSQDLAMILTSCMSDINGKNGVLLAKESKEALFTDKYFTKVFDRDFEELFFKYNIYRIVFQTLGEIRYKRTKTSERRIAKYVITGIVYDSIKHASNLSSWFAKNYKEPSLLFQNNKKTRKFIRIIVDAFKELWDYYIKESKKNPSLYPSDFFSKSKKHNAVMFNRIGPSYRKRLIKSVNDILK